MDMLQFPHIDPVAIKLGPLKVHWYGLMYLFGFAAAWFLGKHRAKKSWTPVKNEEQVGDMIFYCALGVILGGRLGYVFFYNFEKFLGEPLWLLKVWEGGMSFHGGLIGVMLAMIYFSRKIKCNVLDLSDFVAPLVPIGLGAGRIGNFIGGELWGKETDVPWAMVFPRAGDGLLRHPSQLYQFALEGVALFCIIWWFSSKPRPRAAVSALFLACYGFFRFLVEFVRQPDEQLGYLAWDWLTMGQVLSLPMILLGMAAFVWTYKQNKNSH